MKEYFGIILRGIAMGAADVVPGVSGGTIAFITGIYQRLLDAIASFDWQLLSTFKAEGIKGVWKAIDGNFIVALLAGICFSLVTLARLIHDALGSHPIVVWAFFFGLVLASVPFMWRQIERISFASWILLAVGAILALGVTTAEPVAVGDAWWVIFACASIAICATILPGISGSFMLLLLGVYPIVIEAIGYGDLPVILSFAGGALFGLLTFAKGVAYVYKKHTDVVLAVLTGFLLGSLNALWPWKITTVSMVKASGEQVPLVQERVLPETFTLTTGNDSMLIMAFCWFMIGFVLVFCLEKFGANKKQ